jgi:hypothetical protein
MRPHELSRRESDQGHGACRRLNRHMDTPDDVSWHRHRATVPGRGDPQDQRDTSRCQLERDPRAAVRAGAVGDHQGARSHQIGWRVDRTDRRSDPAPAERRDIEAPRRAQLICAVRPFDFAAAGDGPRPRPCRAFKRSWPRSALGSRRRSLGSLRVQRARRRASPRASDGRRTTLTELSRRPGAG